MRGLLWALLLAAGGADQERADGPPCLFPGLQPGDRWAVCAARWFQSYAAGVQAPVVDYPTPTAPIKAAMVGVRTCLQKQVAHLVAAKDPAGEIAADALLGCQGTVDDLNAAQRAAGAADDVKSASGFTITETTYSRDDFRPRVQHLVADALGEHCWWPPKPAAKARVVEVLP